MVKKGKIILDSERFSLTLERLTCQLLEDWGSFDNICIIGIQHRGVLLARRLKEILDETTDLSYEYGELDITFYRDDFRLSDQHLAPYPNLMEFVVTGKRVLIIDDVLYTGRSVHAALAALQHFGRPAEVKLLALVDRRFNRHLPVQADYVGISVDAVDNAYVKVDWGTDEDEGQVLLFDKKENAG